MSRRTEIPQTVEEAEAFGWAWLTVKCLACRHAADIKLGELSKKNLRLGVLGSKLFCGKCQGRRLEFSLGVYVSSAGQLWPQRRRIDFDADKTVCPSRE